MDFFDYAMSENPSRQFRHTYFNIEKPNPRR